MQIGLSETLQLRAGTVFVGKVAVQEWEDAFRQR